MSGTPRQMKMVGWFDPAQLVRTAIEVMVSTLLGRHTDLRLIEALNTGEKLEAYQCAKELAWAGGEFWLDYISDTGDGWDPVYAVAYAAAQEHLELKDKAGNSHRTERGQILVLGGDQVYPTASRIEYQRRFSVPYATAFPDRKQAVSERPKIFAIPGNHDWYDSLASFTRLFCQNRTLGGWHAPQKRSYFAIKLPYNWWMLGTDMQLASDIDEPQVDFFRKVADQFQPHDRIILCNAEPHWINAAVYGELDPEYNENNLRFLEDKILKGRVSIFLAGDLHHYRRHEGPGNVQKITAGGGGAFLHPTHPDQNVRVLKEHDARGREFKLMAAFPSVSESSRLAWGNLGFLFKNPSLGIVTSVVYVMVAGALGEYEHSAWGFFTKLVNTPFAAFLVTLTIAGYMFFTDTHSRPYKVIAGGLHGVANLAAAFAIRWYARELSKAWEIHDPLDTIFGTLVTFAGGWIAGPVIMGIYLLISLNMFGRHSNEAFSALAIKHYKNFLRMKIDPNGQLTIYPIGLRRVPEKWKQNPSDKGSCMEPDDPNATKPELIEDPIRLR